MIMGNNATDDADADADATNDTNKTTAVAAAPSIMPILLRVTLSSSSSSSTKDNANANDDDDAASSLEDSLGLRLKLSDEHEGAIVIYHIAPGESSSCCSCSSTSSSSTSDLKLKVGCEILAVNDHRVKQLGGVGRVVDVLRYYAAKHGKVNILASYGHRPRGSMYIVAKNSNKPNAQSSNTDPFSGTGTIINGLELEETAGGRVRVLSAENASIGCFSGLRLNKGDCIYTINGTPIKSIIEARGVLKDAADENHVMIPILTYNVFRRLRTTVMSTQMLVGTAGKSWNSMQERRKSVNIEDVYNVQEKLGEGAFAVVKKATHKMTGEVYALKIVNRASLNSDMESSLKEEISVLRELNNDHIMKLDNVVVTINHYYLVAEYLEGGELFDRIVDKSSYTESEARDTCNILFGALSYMNSKGIVHRDLKPENLLLQFKNSDSEIKIADFGFAKKATGDHSLSTMCGTPGYVAPEILRKEKYGTKADMWSMGCIIFIMLGGYPPFYADSPGQLLRLSRIGKFEFDPDFWEDISDGAKDLISFLLVTDPAKRSSADDILSHSWMRQDGQDLLKMSLSKTQAELKKYIARMRFKKAIHSVLFVTHFSGANAVFSDRNKRRAVKALEEECAKLDITF